MQWLLHSAKALAYPPEPSFCVAGMLVNFDSTMLHSFHHASQHASVCGTPYGTWAAFRVAVDLLVSAAALPQQRSAA